MKKPIPCQYCGKTFRHRHRLFRHMLDKHLQYVPEGYVVVKKED